MKIISTANEAVLEILEKFKKHSDQYRRIYYIAEEVTEDGILLFNLLTRELILLTEEEYNRIKDLDYLKDRWFLVPEGTNEKELVSLVRWVLSTRQKKQGHITGYTIFTTTDCNARCFYCFELGRSRIPMSEETAYKTAKYICDHCGGENVNISWFGGEPLFNSKAIDIICDELRKAGVEFRASATTNGYLLDEKTVEKAVKSWNLKRVQITLDGTEKVYNKIKAYIYKDTNPYQIVMDNIGHLLNADVTVQIRLNMDLNNAENLLELVDELAKRFPDHKRLYIYARHIFKSDKPLADIHTKQEWEKHDRAMRLLNERIVQNGLARKGGIKKEFRLHYCMADSGQAVTVLPNGEIGLCEHYTESEFIGHLDGDRFDETVIKRWRETIPEIPECDTCFYYPECILLKMCSNCSVCFQQERERFLDETKLAMVNEYKKWLMQMSTEESDDNLC